MSESDRVSFEDLLSHRDFVRRISRSLVRDEASAEDGKPVGAGGPLCLEPVNSTGRRIPIDFYGVTDSDGRFLVRGLPDGYPYHVEAGGGSSGWLHTVRSENVDAGSTDVTIRLRPAATIRGTLLDAEGHPLRGWNILVTTARHGDSACAATGMDGKGSLRNKCVLCTESADAPDPARSEEESTPLRVADDERRRWAGRGGPRMQQVIS